MRSKKVANQTKALGDATAFKESADILWSDATVERVVVGCMMDAERYTEIEGIVKANMFFHETYRMIADACQFLLETGRNVDPVSVKSQLKEQGYLEEETLRELIYRDIMECARAAIGYDNPLEHANRLRDLWTIREARNRVKDWYTNSNAPGTSVGSLLSQLENVASFTVQDQPNVLVPFHMIDLEKSPDVGYTTGFTKLDNMIQTHGYPKGQLSVVEAYHKGGKSTFMLSSFSEQLKLGLDPVYVSFADLNAARIKRRLMRMRTGWGDMPTASFDLQERWLQEHEELCEQDPRIVDATKTEHLRTVEGITRYLRGLARKRPIQEAFLDYFQRITTSDPKARTDYDKNKIVADKLANFAEETGIALVVGSQVTPGGPGRETISKGGRDIEENAGWVLRLKREGDSDTIEVEIPFSRFGIQNTKPIQMTFDKDRLRVTQ